MIPKLITTASFADNDNLIVISNKTSQFDKYNLLENELNYVMRTIGNEVNLIPINQYNRWIFICVFDETKPEFQINEAVRKLAAEVQKMIIKEKIKQITVVNNTLNHEVTIAMVEGLMMSNYQYNKYFSEKEKPKHSATLEQIAVTSEVSRQQIEELTNVFTAIYNVRNLINEPHSSQSATQFANEIQSFCSQAGVSVEILEKSKIEALKMGGVLAVNRGSIDPPTFTIMQWKPADAVNKQPIVLVGKGIVFDTGGLNLKVPRGSMDTMKQDMAGGATVAGLLYCIAKNNLPLHVIGLVPATDNRPGGNAFVPGDVIWMHNGLTVEVLNTDAEGRLILADALSYAQRYSPELVIDLATLTGSAMRAIGKEATVVMGTANSDIMTLLEQTGFDTYERIVAFPLWDEYGEYLKSDIADLANIGGDNAGAIVAGKFLQRFTDYPWIHFDIAATAFFEKADSYWGQGATGQGIRLIYQFLKKYFSLSKV